MRYEITTQHADYEKLFGGPSITVEGDADGLRVVEADNPKLIGENIEVSADGDIAEQLSAMYGHAAVEIVQN